MVGNISLSNKDRIRVHAIYLAQDDRKKNTAVKLSKKSKITLHENFRRIPRKGILLDPLCGKIFGPEDHLILKKRNPLVALDCSWKQIDDSLSSISKKTKLIHRTLPILLAANPVNWGKPTKLTTAEAIAATLYLTGDHDHAEEILSIFNWGSQFFTLNKEPLDEYASASTSDELVKMQFDFFD
ncbi:MAG: DUF367 family protein [Methanobacteriota archaeon]|nr:MAG: DUF367 family protein [Euryarchaeota archaeon]|tara:strand:- start:38129 stop:38680 length:552 start_codon:yes stop_codon:yes gene_type:complete